MQQAKWNECSTASVSFECVSHFPHQCGAALGVGHLFELALNIHDEILQVVVPIGVGNHVRVDPGFCIKFDKCAFICREIKHII